jgi:hypothetical protein
MLFALMNSAPAELLHLLVDAALQPIGYPFPDHEARAIQAP